MLKIQADLNQTTMHGVILLARFGLHAGGWGILAKQHTNATFPAAMARCRIRTMESIIHMKSLQIVAALRKLETWTMDDFEGGQRRHRRCPARAPGMLAPLVYRPTDHGPCIVVFVFVD